MAPNLKPTHQRPRPYRAPSMGTCNLQRNPTLAPGEAFPNKSTRLPLADHQPRPAAPRAPDFTSLANPRGGPGQWLEEEEEAAARALLEAPLRAWERRGGLHKPQAAENGLPEPEGRGRQCCCVEKGQIHSSPLVVIQS
ncbi:unnamed protein product [Arctogadus glacialis]